VLCAGAPIRLRRYSRLRFSQMRPPGWHNGLRNTTTALTSKTLTSNPSLGAICIQLLAETHRQSRGFLGNLFAAVLRNF